MSDDPTFPSTLIVTNDEANQLRIDLATARARIAELERAIDDRNNDVIEAKGALGRVLMQPSEREAFEAKLAALEAERDAALDSIKRSNEEPIAVKIAKWHELVCRVGNENDDLRRRLTTAREALEEIRDGRHGADDVGPCPCINVACGIADRALAALADTPEPAAPPAPLVPACELWCGFALASPKMPANANYWSTRKGGRIFAMCSPACAEVQHVDDEPCARPDCPLHPHPACHPTEER